MKRKPVWPWLVLGVLALCLAFSCSTTKPHLGLPPVDVHNNLTGAGSEADPQPDGMVDKEFLTSVDKMRDDLNSGTGGIFGPWLTAIAQLTGLGAAGLLAYKKLMGEIKLTDQNVATVAAKAGVPEDKMV